MKQKLIVLLLLVTVLFMIIPQGGEVNDSETASASESSESGLNSFVDPDGGVHVFYAFD